MKNTSKQLLFLLLTAFVFSCQQRITEQPVTTNEAIAFARSLESSIKKNGEIAVNGVIDEDIFAERVAEAAHEGENSAAIRDIKKTFRQRNISKEILGQVTREGSYEFVRHYEKDKHHHVIFRLYGNDGVNYHDFELAKHENKIAAADIFVYTSGENLSKSLAAVMSSLMDNSNGKQKEITAYVQNLNKMKQLCTQEKYTEARDLFNTLPQDMRKEKIFQTINIRIASKMDKESYIAALDEFEKLYGSDPSAQLILFDNYLLKKDYTKALHALDDIDRSVHDPFLNFFRALIYKQEDKKSEATPYLEKLYAQMPQFGDGVLELIANYIDSKRYDKAKTLVAAYKANASFDQTKLQGFKYLYPHAVSKIDL